MTIDTDQLFPSPWPAPRVESYDMHGRTLWAWECRGAPGCDGHAGVRGFRSEAEARQGWRAHVRREHRRVRPPATTSPEPTSTTVVGGAPTCRCGHDGLPVDYHLGGCPISGRPALTPDQVADVETDARAILAAMDRATARHREATAHLPEPPPAQPAAPPGRPAYLPPSSEECPPGVHSLFDFCPGTCRWQTLPLTHGGAAQDERGLLIPAEDQWDRDYEIRLTPETAAELAAELVLMVDEDALADTPPGADRHNADYLAGYAAAIARVHRALRIDTEEKR